MPPVPVGKGDGLVISVEGVTALSVGCGSYIVGVVFGSVVGVAEGVHGVSLRQLYVGIICVGDGCSIVGDTVFETDDVVITNTKSLSPPAFLVGLVNDFDPEFDKFVPASVLFPFVGSYQLAEATPESFVISTVSVLAVGTYATIRDPSFARPAVT